MNRPSAESVVALLLKENPCLHQDAEGRDVNWGLDAEALGILGKVMGKDFVTAETGCGLSSILLGAVARRHLVVCPDAAEVQRVVTFLEAKELPNGIEAVLEGSEKALPVIETRLGKDRLDLALIDGAHRYPFPILDWYYFAQAMKPGGVMVVDDIQIPTVNVLLDYLKMDEHWRLDAIGGKTAFFTKLKDECPVNDWMGQALNRMPVVEGTAVPSVAVLRKLIVLKLRHGVRQRLGRLFPKS